MSREIQSLGSNNEFFDNIAILGPDDLDGPAGNGLTTVLQDACGPRAGVDVTPGSVWQGNIAFSMKTGNRLTQSSCPNPISSTANMLGIAPTSSGPSRRSEHVCVSITFQENS